MSDDLPTARSMLPQDSWLCWFVSCKACHRQAPADLRAIIDAGKGDVPVKERDAARAAAERRRC
jgi:hypothetical protein